MWNFNYLNVDINKVSFLNRILRSKIRCGGLLDARNSANYPVPVQYFIRPAVQKNHPSRTLLSRLCIDKRTWPFSSEILINISKCLPLWCSGEEGITNGKLNTPHSTSIVQCLQVRNTLNTASFHKKLKSPEPSLHFFSEYILNLWLN